MLLPGWQYQMKRIEFVFVIAFLSYRWNLRMGSWYTYKANYNFHLLICIQLTQLFIWRHTWLEWKYSKESSKKQAYISILHFIHTANKGDNLFCSWVLFTTYTIHTYHNTPTAFTISFSLKNNHPIKVLPYYLLQRRKYFVLNLSFENNNFTRNRNVRRNK